MVGVFRPNTGSGSPHSGMYVNMCVLGEGGVFQSACLLHGSEYVGPPTHACTSTTLCCALWKEYGQKPLIWWSDPFGIAFSDISDAYNSHGLHFIATAQPTVHALRVNFQANLFASSILHFNVPPRLCIVIELLLVK